MIFPQLAQQAELTSLEKYIDDDNWVMEQKLDGHRVLLVSPPRAMAPTALTRNGSLYTRKLPTAIQNFRFPEGEWILDGELVDGTFWVFDIPKTPNNAVDGAALWSRRAMLESFLANVNHPFKLVPQARTSDEKIKLAEQSLKNNFEGLLLKKRDTPYRSGGRTSEWLKVKYKKTIDVVVLDVRDDGKESARLGIYRDGTLIDVGRASLIGKEKRGLISVGDVIEVLYLYCNNPDQPRLYQPTILRRRNDKRPDECDAQQLKYTDKTVLPSLDL